MAAVGMGCEYDECKCVVPLLCVMINDGFETMNLFYGNFVWWVGKKRRGCERSCMFLCNWRHEEYDKDERVKGVVGVGEDL